MSKEMIQALDALEQEKGVKKEVVIEALEAALVSAYKRNYNQAQNVDVEFDPKQGDIHIYAVKEVTDEVFDSRLEVSLKEALAINKAYEIGDQIKFEVTPKDFGRIAAQTAKQLLCSGFVKLSAVLFMTNIHSMKMRFFKGSLNAEIIGSSTSTWVKSKRS